jgi:hypothetical protein
MYPEKNVELKKYIVTLQKAVYATFDSADWKEFGYETERSDYIENHARLLRSLYYGDEDYGSCVYDVLEELLDYSQENFQILIKKEKIKRWIKLNDDNTYSALYEQTSYIPAPKPSLSSPNEVMNIALKDAEDAVAYGNPLLAVDRTHTALHEYLRVICTANNIEYKKDDTIMRLFSLIITKHKPSSAKTQWADDIVKIGRSLATSVDSINTLRNHASLAHANSDLLGGAEAMLAINASRTIFNYIDQKYTTTL